MLPQIIYYKMKMPSLILKNRSQIRKEQNWIGLFLFWILSATKHLSSEDSLNTFLVAIFSFLILIGLLLVFYKKIKDLSPKTKKVMITTIIILIVFVLLLLLFLNQTQSMLLEPHLFQAASLLKRV